VQEPPFFAACELFTFADFEVDWSWLANGVGVDFTGCTAAFAARVTPADERPAFAVSTTPGASGSIALGTAEGEDLGFVQLTVTAAAIAAVTVPVLHGDLLITFANGTIVQFAHLDLTIRQGSTY
jgi:hypothetical protein